MLQSYQADISSLVNGDEVLAEPAGLVDDLEAVVFQFRSQPRPGAVAAERVEP